MQQLKRFSLALTVSSLLIAFGAQAEVKLPALFTDGMVLQQGMPVPVWGWADEGENVTVEFAGQKHSVRTRNGKWMLKLDPLKADAHGRPLKIAGNNSLTVNDVLVGEVWIASGQSNMEWSMTRSHSPAEDIAAASHPQIRLFTVPKLKANEPVPDVRSNWQPCTPQTVPGFSAVAYYFARDLHKALGVPVGIIHTSWGGSPAEVWMSEQALSIHPAYQREILDSWSAAHQRFQENLANWEKEKAAAEQAGQSFNKNRPSPGWKPTELYNGMIAPLIPYAIKGAIWYQGESNAGRAHQYRTLYPDMIRNWRADWGQGDFAFLGVQLAPWDKNRKRSIEEITAAPVESDWAELREAQVLSTQVLPRVGLAIITDAGDKDDIHPAKKEPVGARLALLARRIAYGESLVASGPAYENFQVKDGKAILSFANVGGGLEARGGELKGFAVAGEDRKFVWAKAQIENDKVVVSSPEISNPVAVRYGWADYPVVNLFNKEGLPASPFRTDDFPMLTAPKN
jgi:sialate O-acetylesterase